MAELKPCPFCGGTRLSPHEGSTHRWAYLACDDCGGNKGDCRKPFPYMPAIHDPNMEALIADWNDRTPAAGVMGTDGAQPSEGSDAA